jgi:glycosyltransferase involved in cell wall biosynthesis
MPDPVPFRHANMAPSGRSDGPGSSKDEMLIAQVNDIAAVAGTLAREMRKLGERAVVVETRRFGTGLRYPWKVAVLPLRGAAILRTGLALRRGHYDVVHVHFARLGMLGPMSGRPYTLHVHGTDIRGVRPGSAWGREIAPFMRRARLVYYATPDLREWVEPFRPDAIFLPNPIETDLFSPAAADATGQRDRPRRDLLVGVRLSAVKGLATILDVIGRVVVTRPGTTITIVDQGDGAAQAAAVAGPNAALAPRVARAELPDLIRGHRLALGQFLVGTFGNYELEAEACGVPVVMGFDRWAAYDTRPPIVAAATAEEAAARICSLLDDDAELARLAALGPPWVAANHAAGMIAARVLGDYRRTGQGPR